MEYDAVFEGGGARGIAFVGALEPFLEEHSFGRLVGTSAGAIIATLLTVGYSATELQDILSEEVNNQPVFAQFLSSPSFTPLPAKYSIFHHFTHRLLYLLPYYRKFASLMLRGGLYSANGFETWLAQKLDRLITDKLKMKDMRLGDLHALTGKHLTLVATDTTANQLLILNHNTAPRCPVIQAVRMSMSIPFLWQEVSWQREWGGYLGVSITGHRIVDGGMLSSFPIELLLSTDPFITDKMAPESDNPVIGFLLDEELAVPDTKTAKRASNLVGSLFGTGLSKRFLDLIETMMKAHDKIVLDSYQDAVVRLPVKGFGATEFAMSDKRRNAIVDAARDVMLDYLEEGAYAVKSAESSYSLDSIRSEREQLTIDNIARRMFGLEPFESEAFEPVQ